MSFTLAQFAERWDLQDEVSEESKNQRRMWVRHAVFWFSCVGYAVGLGNVWRFPFLCFENGGGAFLLAYILVLISVGLPLFFLELSLGQYVGAGCNTLFRRLAPGFKGTGYAMTVVTFLVVIYYNMIIGWGIFYMFASFTEKLGWESCSNEWNTPDCFRKDFDVECMVKNLTFWNNTCYDPADFCNQFPGYQAANSTHCLNVTDPTTKTYVSLYKVRNRRPSSEEYHRNYVLGISGSIGNFGSIRWQLVLCLLLAWIILAVIIIKRIELPGIVVYFSAIFPYAALLILLVQGLTLKGSLCGIYSLFVPKWNRLTETKTWGNAAIQMFYSLGIGFGGLHILSSYNPFKSNCCRDAVGLVICNFAASVFAGTGCFTVLGFMAETMQVPFEDVILEGRELAFVAYPEAVTHMPFPPFWSFLFFFMIITVGIDTQVVMFEALITAAQDEWPSLHQRKPFFVIAMCGALFLLGLPLCCENGVYYFTLLDRFSAGWPLVIITAIECYLISWNYGFDRYSVDVKDMTGKRPGWYWKICWSSLSPLTNVTILLIATFTYMRTEYDDYEFPMWADSLGFLIPLFPIALIPIFAIREAYIVKKNNKPWNSLLQPTEMWKPQSKERPKLPDTGYLVSESPPPSERTERQRNENEKLEIPNQQ